MRPVRSALLSLLILAVGCSAEPGATSPSAPPPDQVTGVITDLRFEGDDLVSFVVEARDSTYEILIDPERDYGFNLKHLTVHQEDQLPVLVELESRDGDLYAVEILDA